MNLLGIEDLGDWRVRVSLQRAGETSSFKEPVLFSAPLTLGDQGELSWYLEEYLRFPYGAEGSRARMVESKMVEWGRTLFEEVFPTLNEDADPRALYHAAVQAGPDQCELCVSSGDASFLSIPWELIYDPTPGMGFLAPLLGGLYRRWLGHRTGAPTETPRVRPFRVLLVVSRPFGERDIRWGTVARPVLESLRPLQPLARLEVLRPPTFSAFTEKLREGKGHYQLVHFDGHGGFTESPRDTLQQFGAVKERGYLVFEKETGEPDLIKSRDVSQALVRCGVPLFVLNACKSAKEGHSDPYASIASQLVAIGAEGVVAMSYSVYASAAAKFMERFYQSLMSHSSLAQAVAVGRRCLRVEPRRESIAGFLDLQDWMVPALYQKGYDYTPFPKGEMPEPSDGAVGHEALLKRAEVTCPLGRHGFVGRDNDILRIERELRDEGRPWVLVTGMGGIGKTEFVRGFGRWYAETGGCPGGLFATSFRGTARFSQVIGSIVGCGSEVSIPSDEDQWNRLVSFLAETPCLLVWDDFESVAGYPEGGPPPASERERERLSRFLRALQGGRSRVIIATRKPPKRNGSGSRTSGLNSPVLQNMTLRSWRNLFWKLPDAHYRTSDAIRITPS